METQTFIKALECAKEVGPALVSARTVAGFARTVLFHKKTKDEADKTISLINQIAKVAPVLYSGGLFFLEALPASLVAHAHCDKIKEYVSGKRATLESKAAGGHDAAWESVEMMIADLGKCAGTLRAVAEMQPGLPNDQDIARVQQLARQFLEAYGRIGTIVTLRNVAQIMENCRIMSDSALTTRTISEKISEATMRVFITQYEALRELVREGV